VFTYVNIFDIINLSVNNNRKITNESGNIKMKNFKTLSHDATLSNIDGMSHSELQRASLLFELMYDKFSDDEYGCTNALIINTQSAIKHRIHEIETCEHDFDMKPNYSYIKCKTCGYEIYE
jgi:hypothetical protein